MIKENLNSVTAFAPASVANCIVGYDILGFSFDKIGDEVRLVKNAGGLKFIEIISKDEIPKEIGKNIVSILLKKISEDLGFEVNFDIYLNKGIPISSGLGGSAASIAATLVAINHFLVTPIEKNKLIEYAGWAEGIISGTAHLDNVVPSLFGGFCLLSHLKQSDYISLPIPDKFYAVIVHPEIKIETKNSREVIMDELSISSSVMQSASLARFICFLYGEEKGADFQFQDFIAEPHRKDFLIGFDELKKKVVAKGAMGFSFSGSGPSLLSFTNSEESANDIKELVCKYLNKLSIKNSSWVHKLNRNFAKIIEVG